MAKLVHFVAIGLIAVVLGGAQCADWCAFLAPQPEKQPPCHQKQSADACAHHEIVAERQALGSKLSTLESFSFAEAGFDGWFVPLPTAVAVSSYVAREPDPGRKLRPIVLRI